MSIDVSGKKLLVLGGTTLMIHVVKVAQSMGVYTIVTDMAPDSPAKGFADKSFDISTGDIESIVEMARDERIDGIFTGYDDFNTEVAVELSEILDVPFYATKQQIEITKRKNEFKALCRQFDVPVVKEYDITNVEYPCVVKPSDSYSAKGITICRSADELNDAIEFALSFSKTGNYLIEKYMDCDCVDCVNIDYVISDGEIFLSAVGDKKVVRQANKAPLTSAVYYPSRHMEAYIRDVDEKVKEMFKHLGMKNGTVFIESFYDNDGYAIYEMGYRVGGGQSSILLNEICDVDYVKMLINFALCGKMGNPKHLDSITPKISKYACGLVLLVKSGIISKIIGLDEVRKSDDIINITQYIHEGDEISEKFVGTLGQTFARIHIVSDTEEKMNDTIEFILHTIRVEDKSGNNLLVENHPTY